MDREYPTGPIDNFLSQMSDLDLFRHRRKKYFETLTDREKEVLTLIAKGMTNPKISTKLKIARSTVQNHRAHIRDKLNINHQTDFIKYSLAYGLIEF